MARKPSSKDDSIEVKLVLGLVRGLAWLIMLPFRGLGQSKPKAGRSGVAVDTQEVARRWSDIQTTVGLGGVTHFGSAVVSADKLLDYVLRQKGYAGETMGDRLKNAKDDVSPAVYHNVWQAHKLRNQLVHEVGSEVLSFQVKEALQSYEQMLRELGALR